MCFACGRTRVDVKSFTEYERTDECLCVNCKEDPNPYKKPDACLGCTLFRRPGIVGTRGRMGSKLMFIAEKPGAEEAKFGVRRPLMGGSGRIHDKIVNIAGSDSTEHFTTNCVKCKPMHSAAPTDLEIRMCARFLIEEISQCNPNIIVALGDIALRVLTDKVSISRHRGVPTEGFAGRKVIATWNPSYVMRDQSKFAMPIFDIQRALAESEFPEIRRVPVSYNTNARPETDGLALLERVRRTGIFVEDIETTGLDPTTSQIICNGMSDGTPGTAESYRWSPATADLTRAAHEDPAIEVVGQNSESFDIWYLEGKGIPIPKGRSFDTMLAAHLINAELPKDLGTIGSFYTDMEYWKGDSKKDLFHYNCQDIDGTARAYHGQKAELKQMNMTSLYYDHVMPLQPVLRAMTRRGIKKDMLTAAKWIVALTRKADEMEATLREGLGQPFLNVNSPKDMMKLLYDTLGLPMQFKKTKSGYRPTADADAIDVLCEKFPDMKILQLVGQIRTIRSKWISTYLQAETDENNFVHPKFGSAKAANGRLNSWDPNGQNIPYDLREIYVADDEDHVWIEADWGQIEWRNTMVLAGDAAGLRVMTSGLDIFRSVASDVRKLAIEAVDDDVRHSMKFIVYGFGYGRQAPSIAAGLGWTESQALTWMNGYLNTYPDFRDHRKEMEKQVAQQYFLANPFMRRRWWFTRQITEMYNFPASSTAADQMYYIMPRVERELPKGATIRLSVHDALDVVAHRDVAKLASECLKDHMNTKWPQVVDASRKPDVVKRAMPGGYIIPSDLHIGRNWKEAKKGNKALEKEILG